MERHWRIGEDLSTHDSLLDGLTFDDIILAAHHLPIPTPDDVKRELREMLESRFEDMWFLFDNNIDVIIKEALKGRN